MGQLSGERIFAEIRDSQLLLWAKSGGEQFEILFEARLDRSLVDPVLECSGDIFTVTEFFVEGDQVKIFRFSVIRPGVEPARTFSETLALITEKTDIQDLHCLKVANEKMVIAYNVSGRSRVHLFTTEEERMEVIFLGNVETEVRDLCLLHGPDKMFIYQCDSRLIIWNLADGKCLSKPIFLPSTRILGALVIKTKLCFVVHDGKQVKLSIIENQRFKDFKFFQIGDDSIQNPSLLSIKQDFLTFLTGLRVLHLNLITSEIICETLF